ncbi:MAG: alpha-glucan family phosphorylase [Thermodesulfobacteriota bacterium]
MAVRALIVQPDLPPQLDGLQRIAMNLWHSWNPEVARLFQTLDPDLWERTGHNPVALLAGLAPERVEEILGDDLLMDRIRDADREFEAYTSDTRFYSFNLDRPIDYRIAYFSMEYGLSEALPIYSGGLGMLAGDHLKSASNLSFPLIGIGLLYQKGYCRQYLNVDGWQQESYPDNDFYNLPVSRVLDGTGKQATIEVDLAGEIVKIRIWKIQVGRVPLYMLDSNDPANSEAGRSVTAELYGGDLETRIRQEIVLGIGGARALHLLGFWPFVYHLNEGHAAFAALERIRLTMKAYRVPFDVAMEAVAASTVFTTHTPVPAGIDLFQHDLVDRYFRNYTQGLGITVKDLLDLGREDPNDRYSPLSMAVLAMRLSRGVNAVSELHSRVSKKMWARLWPHVDKDDIPIGYVTNGVHVPSYVSKEMADLLSRYLGANWVQDPDNEKIWPRVQSIPNDELWRVHETRRERLVTFCRRRLASHGLFSGETSVRDVRRAREVLNPEALTIGFARRFAPYKRAGLVFTDPDRLLALVSDKRRPVQFIFGGKAHPRDNLGKELIKNVVHIARQEGFRRKLVFLEDYDINVARYLVQGVDVWLNNPRRPYEACGTSGMKAAANGALNLSVLDGWWPEGYDATNGWAIGNGEEYDDPAYGDKFEAQCLYDLLETEVIPRFFDRGPNGVPNRWVEMMKNSMATICRRFNSHRMIEQYLEEYYIQAGIAHQILGENRLARARELRAWKQRVKEVWKDVQVVDVTAPQGDSLSLGSSLTVNALLQLGRLTPEEVVVSLWYGPVDPATEQVSNRHLAEMKSLGRRDDGLWAFEGQIACEETGIYAYRVRVLPFHSYLSNPLSMGLITWG